MAGIQSSEVGVAHAWPEVASLMGTVTADGTLPSEEADRGASCLP